jgi:hypothetical protein
MPATRQYSEKPDFDSVWLFLQESSREFDRRMLESKERFEKIFREHEKFFQEHEKISQEHEKYLKELDRKHEISEKKAKNRFDKLEELFTGQWGKLVESLVEGKVVKLLKDKGIDVVNTYSRIRNETNNIEIDILAANGNDVVIIEVKTTLNIKKVKEFISKLKEFKKYFPKFADNQVMGAVAYLRSTEGAEEFSKKSGLWVIRATGDSASIVNPTDFKPRIW